MTTDDMESLSSQSKTVTVNNPLEQFVLLAKTTKGAACLELVKQVLEAPGVHVFGELLDMPNIKELETGMYSKCFTTLNLFAYGTYKQYLLNKTDYLDLTSVMCKKLQHLTIVSLAIKNKCISYSLLLEELDIKNVRDLEDLIIEAIYADIIHGKLDQKNKLLEVDYAIGRDIRPGDVSVIVSTLQEWCDSCEAVLGCVESQINRANSEKSARIQHKADIEHQINEIKKSLKTQSADPDEAMSSEPREVVGGQDKMKKSGKCKGIRVTGMKILH